MSAFILVIARESIPPSLELPVRTPFMRTQPRTLRGDRWQLTVAAPERFPQEHAAGEDAEMLLALTGVVLNDEELMRATGGSSLFEAVKAHYRRSGSRCLKELRGVFSGVLLDKATGEWLVFTDHTASRPVFHYRDQDYRICSSSLPNLHAALRRLGRTPALDPVGAYCLLTTDTCSRTTPCWRT